MVAIGVLALILAMPKQGGPSNSGAAPAQNEPANDGGQNNGGEQILSKSLNEIMASAVPTKCTYSMAIDSAEGGAMNGTVYAAGGQARSDVDIEMPGQEKMTIHAIVKDGFEYAWYDNGPMAGTGMKLDINKIKEAAQNQPQSQQSVDLEKKMDMICLPWAIQANLFEPPAGINFEDITAQTGQMMENAPKNACDACAMMPSEELKQQCRQAGNCPAQ